MIRNIKELKDIILKLPDDMEIMGYNGVNGDLCCVSYWINSDETLTEEEKHDSYPDGVIPTLVLSIA